MPNSRSLENLRPIQPGQVLNPTGRNQYTYRRDFEEACSRLFLGEITAEELTLVDAEVRALIPPGASRGEVLAHLLLLRALRGDERCLSEVLARAWPKTERLQHSGEIAIEQPGIDLDYLMDRLEKVAEREREKDPGH